MPRNVYTTRLVVVEAERYLPELKGLNGRLAGFIVAPGDWVVYRDGAVAEVLRPADFEAKYEELGTAPSEGDKSTLNTDGTE